MINPLCCFCKKPFNPFWVKEINPNGCFVEDGSTDRCKSCSDELIKMYPGQSIGIIKIRGNDEY